MLSCSSTHPQHLAVSVCQATENTEAANTPGLPRPTRHRPSQSQSSHLGENPGPLQRCSGLPSGWAHEPKSAIRSHRRPSRFSRPALPPEPGESQCVLWLYTKCLCLGTCCTKRCIFKHQNFKRNEHVLPALSFPFATWNAYMMAGARAARLDYDMEAWV